MSIVVDKNSRSHECVTILPKIFLVIISNGFYLFLQTAATTTWMPTRSSSIVHTEEIHQGHGLRRTVLSATLMVILLLISARELHTVKLSAVHVLCCK